jgi:hypothetical protein
MATKPVVKKVKNGNLTKNGKVKVKSMSQAQLTDLINKGAQKNATSKVGKTIAKYMRAFLRLQPKTV